MSNNGPQLPKGSSFAQAWSDGSEIGVVRRSIAAISKTGVLLPLVVLFATLASLTPSFLTPVNLFNLLDQQSTILIVAAAGTLVLIAGGLDLSVGAVFALCGLVAVQLANTVNTTVSVIAVIAIGLFIGTLNGVLVTVIRLTPMIATLASSYIVAGVATVAAGGTVLIAHDPSFRVLGNQQFGPIALTSIIAVGVLGIFWFLLSATAYGRAVFAVGGNEEAARLSGIRTTVVKISTYSMSGAMAGFAGMLAASRVGSGQADFGGQTSLMFTVLVGIVVGGTSLIGGEGAVWRTLVGVLFIAVIHNGFVLLSLDSVFEQIIVGSLIIVAVGADSWRRLRSN